MTTFGTRPLVAGALLLTALLAMTSGCGSSADSAASTTSDPAGAEVVRMWIGPELVECVGVAPMECMLVSYTEDGEPQLFYDTIDGFDHQEGTSYVVDVSVTEVASPPADASSLSYTLVEIVSQTP